MRCRSVRCGSALLTQEPRTPIRLEAKQREKALLPFDSAKKPSWSNLPVPMVPRNGLSFGELTKPQRTAALEVVAAVLSKEGYQKVIDIMNADDQINKDKENKMKFGTEN